MPPAVEGDQVVPLGGGEVDESFEMGREPVRGAVGRFEFGDQPGGGPEEASERFAAVLAEVDQVGSELAQGVDGEEGARLRRQGEAGIRGGAMEELELDRRDDGLKEVVARDKDLFEEVLQSYVDLFGVTAKLLDAEGNRLVGASARSDLCRYVYSIDTCQEACRDIVASIRLEPREPPRVTPAV